MAGQRKYLDTSALAKRYVEEEGSKHLDLIFEEAEKGEASILFSLWNIGEMAVVLDKYEREGMLSASKVMRTFLGEMKRLGKAKAAEVVLISGSLMADAIVYSLRHHIYVADALQVSSCKSIPEANFVTADHRLASVAREEGLSPTLVG